MEGNIILGILGAIFSKHHQLARHLGQRCLIVIALLVVAQNVRADETPRIGTYGLKNSTGERPEFMLGKLRANDVQNDEMIPRLQRAGIPLIVELQYQDRKSWKRSASVPLSDTSFNDITRHLNNMRRLQGTDILAFTLDEEMPRGRAYRPLLRSTYQKLRPLTHRPIFQWLSPSRRVNLVPFDALRHSTDGWVIDEYFLSPTDYERFVRQLLSIGKPIVSILWLSPEWRLGTHHRDHDATGEWWRNEKKEQILQKTLINLRLGIDTAVFATDLRASGPPITLWKSDNPCKRAFLDRYMRAFKTVRSCTNCSPEAILREVLEYRCTALDGMQHDPF